MQVPITRRLHSHGISSFGDTGVWPNCSRNSRDAFFLRRQTLPRSRMMSLVCFSPSILREPTLHLPHFMAQSFFWCRPSDLQLVCCGSPITAGFPFRINEYSVKLQSSGEKSRTTDQRIFEDAAAVLLAY